MAAIGIVIRPGLSGDAAGKLLGRCRWGMAGLEESMLKHLTAGRHGILMHIYKH